MTELVFSAQPKLEGDIYRHVKAVGPVCEADIAAWADAQFAASEKAVYNALARLMDRWLITRYDDTEEVW